MAYTSRELTIGNIRLGRHQPVRLQSMTNTPTMDTTATVKQSIRMIDAGAELVRITARNLREAENLKVIKQELQKEGYENPLIADIHFNPAAAEEAARHVEKIRINPGNYAGKPPRGKVHFTEEEYRQDLETIRERIKPLIAICKKHGTAMRVGANHGSLSPRIMDRFGDTPEGMATSVMEFCRICDGLDFHNIVVSMKSSNTRVMVQATRLLVKMLQEEGVNYPLHLGVTEAGGGLEGRVKSAVGVGTLLAEGIGDTVRVSLTEAPENELPVARQIVDAIRREASRTASGEIFPAIGDAYTYQRRKTRNLAKILGSDFSPVVIGNKTEEGSENVPDFIPGSEGGGSKLFLAGNQKIAERAYPLVEANRFSNVQLHPELNFVTVRSLAELQKIQLMAAGQPVAYILNSNPTFQYEMIRFLDEKQDDNPVIIHHYSDIEDYENFAIHSSALLGSFFINGRADGLWLENPHQSAENMNELMFTLLQATRSRISKTEFIACPSCGRTLFDIEKTLQAVKERTGHLKGLKIAVMGCIVNGPGEMADADYGYVGAAAGKVTLYKGKTVKKKNISAEKAIDELVNLIKEEGDWLPVKEPGK